MDIQSDSNNIEEVELQSEEVRELIGNPPSALVRYGITVALFVVLGLVLFSLVFKYPDVITGGFVIQTENPPAFLLAKSTGKLQSLLVNEGAQVQPDQLLVVIENPCEFGGYRTLKNLIGSKVNLDRCSLSLDSLARAGVNLGELQPAAAAWVKAIEDYQAYKTIDYFPTKRRSLEQKIEGLKIHIRLLEGQMAVAKQAFEIAQRSFNRDSLLFIDKVIAAHDFENSKKTLLSQKISLADVELTLSNTKLSLAEYHQQKVDLLLNEQQTELAQLATVRQNIENMKSALSEWENRYCLFSPIEGRVALSNIWRENQNLIQGQHVLSVLPGGKTKIIGKVHISTSRAGKVKPHQRVNLKFSDFPYAEYGMVIGSLNALSSVPDSVYIGTVLLPDTLMTNYGKLLPFKQNMKGVAEIITEDVSLAQRIFYPLRAQLNK
jgi:multidrug efflux pump subunit AcrA (membrane-fusion protein)